MKRFLVFLALLAACTSNSDLMPDAIPISTTGPTATTTLGSTSILGPTTTLVSTSTTVKAFDLNPFCPFSPFTAVGPSVTFRRSWVEECKSRSRHWEVSVRSSQFLRLENTKNEPWTIEIGDYHVEIPAWGIVDSPLAASFMDPSIVYELADTSTTLQVRDVSFGPLAGFDILLQQIGPTRPGQTLGEVTTAAGHPVDLTDSYEHSLPDCITGTFRGATGLYMLFTGNGSELRLQYVEVTQPGLSTRSGIEVGDSAEDVVATYGDQVERRFEFGNFDGESLAFLPTTDVEFGLVFILDAEDTVVGIRQGAAGSVGLIEGCA